MYLKMYDLVRLGAKAGLVPRVLVMGDHLVRLLAVSCVWIHEFALSRPRTFIAAPIFQNFI